MALFFWDLAFDFNATPTNGISPLQIGFVSIQPTMVNSPMTAPMPNDSLDFNLFNITNPPGGPYTILDAQITFNSADFGGANPAPFSTPTQVTVGDGSTVPANAVNGTVTIPIGSNAQSGSPGASAYFGPSSSFQRWFLAGPLQLSIAGRFQMGVSVTVQEGTTTKTFVVDPEMIVGGAE